MTNEELRKAIEDLYSDKPWTTCQVKFRVTVRDKYSDESWNMNVKDISKSEGKDWLAKVFIAALRRNYHGIDQISNLFISIIREADSQESLFEQRGIKWKSCDELKTGDKIGVLVDILGLSRKFAHIADVIQVNKEEQTILAYCYCGYNSAEFIIPYSDTISMGNGDKNSDYFYFREGAGPDWEYRELDIELQQ